MRARQLLGISVLACLFPSTTVLGGDARDKSTERPGGTATPSAVVSARSYGALRKAIEQLAKAAGEREKAQMVDALISRATEGQGLEGLDRTKPLGVVFMTGPGGESLPLAFLPVEDPQKFAQTLQRIFPVLYGFVGAQPYKLSGDWFFVGPALKHLGESVPDPERWTSPGSRKYVLWATSEVGSLPPSVRLQFLEAVDRHAEDAETRRPGETASHYHGRQLGTRMVRGVADRLLEDTERITVGLRVSPSGRTLGLEMELGARRNSELESMVAALSRTRSRFSAIADSWSMAGVTSSFPLEGRRQEAALAALRSIGRGASGSDELSAIRAPGAASPSGMPDEARRLLEVLERTLESGMIDAAVSWRGGPSSGVTIVGGCLLVDSEKVDRLLQEVESAESKRGNGAGFRFNATEHDGVKIHVLRNVGAPGRFFGASPSLHVGFGKSSLFVAFGGSSLDEIKWAIDKVQGGRRLNQRATPLSLQLKVRPLLEMLDMAEAATGLTGREKLELVIEPTSRGLLLRVEADAACLGLAGTLMER